jgi:hypothetical protein
MSYSLSDDEKETIILWSYASDTATVDTHDRALITKLKRNPAAVLIEEGVHGSSPWAKFELSKGLIGFRNGKRKLSPEQKAALGAQLRAGRAA